ncbi:NUDIX hydrolase [Streptomonospora nanhaiensis]|jgi:ADP-ribose pyrophosphatase YjhB (NUDIX family)|uniref:NUDIX hydrolase n=1 Tax=Streptomonospora nanhaiensis TaxID=1323731 RepID=A0ABY6YFH0_9ACTN|nr:NUDIX hydrolase [Streptomonospora nanhaiensis]WAE70975.1 NUDIX hydrolase [Streptomonospora nanhaiensis]
MSGNEAAEEPLYVRDPGAWREQLAEGNRFQARKRVAAKVLIRDEQGRLLLVDPVYKPFWDLPGGMAEVNESPHNAARREVDEEVGLVVEIAELLSVEWVAPHGPWDDLLMFVFDGGVVTSRVARELRPRDPELRAIGWYTLEQAARLLREDVWERTRQARRALEDKTILYR